MGKELTVEHLLTDQYRVAQRKGHPRGKQAISVAAYCKLKHVVVSGEEGGFHTFVDAALKERGKKRHVVVSVQQIQPGPGHSHEDGLRGDIACAIFGCV